MTPSQRKNQVRLKIYIPENKFQEWTEYLEEYNQISDFSLILVFGYGKVFLVSLKRNQYP